MDLVWHQLSIYSPPLAWIVINSFYFLWISPTINDFYINIPLSLAEFNFHLSHKVLEEPLFLCSSPSRSGSVYLGGGSTYVPSLLRKHLVKIQMSLYTTSYPLLTFLPCSVLYSTQRSCRLASSPISGTPTTCTPDCRLGSCKSFHPWRTSELSVMTGCWG